MAAGEGDLAGVTAGITAGGDVNYLWRDGWTPLAVLAVQRKGQYVEVAKKLIASMADINFHDNRGRTPLFHAAKYGALDLVEVLSTTTDIDASDQHGKTGLLWAVEAGHAAVAQRMIALKANTGEDMGRNSPKKAALKEGTAAVQALFGGVRAAAAPATAAPPKADL